jgi:hypothetical protein
MVAGELLLGWGAGRESLRIPSSPVKPLWIFLLTAELRLRLNNFSFLYGK